MVKGLKIKRKFDGEEFSLFSTHAKKKNAKNKAKRLRNIGIRARIVKSTKTGRHEVFAKKR